MVKIIHNSLQKVMVGLILLGFLTIKSHAQLGGPPTFSVQPTNTTVQNGGTVTFNAKISSATLLASITWLYNGQPIPSSTQFNILSLLSSGTSTLTISNVIPADAGNYSVQVVNALGLLGTATSSNATLSVVGGVSVDNSSSTNGNASSIVFPHIVQNGANRFLLVNVSTHSGATVSSLTYGGTALTKIGAVASGGIHVNTEMWYLKSPPVGSNNIVLTLSGKDAFAAGASSFFGVDQTLPFGNFTNAVGTHATPAVTVTAAAGQIVVDSVAVHAAFSGTVGAGQNILWEQYSGSTGGDVWGSGSMAAGAPTVKMSWALSTASGSGEWAAAAVALKPAGNASILSSLLSTVTSAGFSLQLSGPVGATMVIEASTNMVDWVPIATNYTATGAISFTDSAATNYPNRYYRAHTL